MSNIDKKMNEIKYVDLNGLKSFAKELKSYLRNHILEVSIYNELKDRIEAVENQDFYKVVDELPEKGVEKLIYLVYNEDNENFLEYIWKGDKFEQLGSFTPQLSLDQYLKIQDSPFEKGSSENSAVLKGGNNFAGLKGWYYDSIYQKNTNTIYVYLKDKQKLLPATNEAFKTTEQTPDTTLPDLFAILGNAIVSLVNNEIHDNMFEIIGGGKGVVHLRTVDQSQIPFNEIKAVVVNDSEDYSIYCVSKPDAGIFDIGQGSIAVGYNNRATNGGAIAFGQDNHSYGKFSFTEGKNNTASYASHAEGRSTQALGYISHTEGNASKAIGAVAHAEGENTEARGRASHSEGLKTIANGDYSHCEGRETKVDSKYAHAEGYKTQATGNASHAEGYTTESSGQFSHAEGTSSNAVGTASHVEGVQTIANNKAEHASGIYNKSTSSTDVSKATHFSIGIGTSDTDRKNAIEVKQNGDVYITGIGGFTGANSDSAKSVQEVINELVDIINQITIKVDE